MKLEAKQRLSTVDIFAVDLDKHVEKQLAQALQHLKLVLYYLDDAVKTKPKAALLRKTAKEFKAHAASLESIYDNSDY